MTAGTFSTRLQEVISRRGLSKQAAASLCKINYNTLNAILIRENAVPNALIAFQIADGLSVSLEWLILGHKDSRRQFFIDGIIGGAGKVQSIVPSSRKGVHIQLPFLRVEGKLRILLVDGDSLAPVFQRGDLLFFEENPSIESLRQSDVGTHIVLDKSGEEWVRFVRINPEIGIIESFDIDSSRTTEHKFDVKWTIPLLLSVSARLVDFIEDAASRRS